MFLEAEIGTRTVLTAAQRLEALSAWRAKNTNRWGHFQSQDTKAMIADAETSAQEVWKKDLVRAAEVRAFQERWRERNGKANGRYTGYSQLAELAGQGGVIGYQARMEIEARKKRSYYDSVAAKYVAGEKYCYDKNGLLHIINVAKENQRFIKGWNIQNAGVYGTSMMWQMGQPTLWDNITGAFNGVQKTALFRARRNAENAESVWGSILEGNWAEAGGKIFNGLKKDAEFIADTVQKHWVEIAVGIGISIAAVLTGGAAAAIAGISAGTMAAVGAGAAAGYVTFKYGPMFEEVDEECDWSGNGTYCNETLGQLGEAAVVDSSIAVGTVAGSAVIVKGLGLINIVSRGKDSWQYKYLARGRTNFKNKNKPYSGRIFQINKPHGGYEYLHANSEFYPFLDHKPLFSDPGYLVSGGPGQIGYNVFYSDNTPKFKEEMS